MQYTVNDGEVRWSFIILQTKKIHEPEILDPKEYLASKFRTQNNTKLEYKYLNMGLFNQTLKIIFFLITQKNSQNYFFQDLKKYMGLTDLLTPQKCVKPPPPPPPIMYTVSTSLSKGPWQLLD